MRILRGLASAATTPSATSAVPTTAEPQSTRTSEVVAEAPVTQPSIEAKSDALPPYVEKPTVSEAVGVTQVAIGPYILDVKEDAIVARHRQATDNPGESGHIAMWTLSGPDGKLLVTAVFIPVTPETQSSKPATSQVEEGAPDKETNPEEEIGPMSPVDKS